MPLPNWLVKRPIEAATLADVLAVAPPDGTADVPLTVRQSPLLIVVVPLFHLLGLVFGVVGLSVAGLLTYETSLIFRLLSLLLVVLILGATALSLASFVRALTVSEEGIRFERVNGERIIRWWTISEIAMPEDLSSVRVHTQTGSSWLALDAMPPADRNRVAVALRARLLATGRDLTRASAGPGILRRVLAVAPGVAIVAVGVVGVFTGDIAIGSPLGIRCSGPSSYLDARFHVREGPGCVVIRVSGSAERAGVKQGDKMIAMNGAPITSGPQFNDRFENEDARSFDFTFIRVGEANPIDIHVNFVPGPGPREDESDPLTWFLRARIDGEAHPARVVQNYTRAIELAPDFDLAYLYRGHAHFIQDENDAALADYDESLRLNPGSAETQRRLGEFHSGELIQDAWIPTSYLLKAIELDHCDGSFKAINVDCAQDYLSLAETLRYRRAVPESIDAAKRAQEFYPRSPDSLYELAASYALLNDATQALAYAHAYLDTPASGRRDSYSGDMRTLIKLAEEKQ